MSVGTLAPKRYTFSGLGQRLGGAFNAFVSNLFGPLAPLEPDPVTQQEGARTRSYLVGSNISYMPRQAEGLTPFEWLISIASLYDTASICIRYRMQEIMGMRWEIADQDANKAASAAEKRDAAQWLERPDGRTPWMQWVSQLVEELMVTDAVSIQTIRSRSGLLLEAIPIDGATIKVLIDKNGRTPAGGAPAYQQILYGKPWWEGTVDDLLYAPMHRRTRSAYGKSPTEDLVLTINRALRRQIHDVNYYAKGNIPDAILPVPDLQPEQLDSLQEYFDEIVNQPEQRRKMHLVPSTTGRLVPFQFKPPINDTEVEEFLDRRAMASYAVPPQELGFTGDINRAQGSMQENVLLRRRRPTKVFLESIHSELLHAAGFPNTRFLFLDERPEEDALRQAQVDKITVSTGLKTIDQWCRDNGLHPLGIDEPFVLTPQGPVWLKQSLAEGNQPPPAPFGAGKPGRGQSTQPGAEDLKGEGNKDVTAGDNLSNSDAAARALGELRQWEKFATRDAKRAAGRPFTFAAVPTAYRGILQAAEGDVETVRLARQLIAAALRENAPVEE